jgi:hypothetical protein
LQQVADESGITKFETILFVPVEKAMARYGDKGKDGAVIVTVKKVKEAVTNQNSNDLNSENPEPKIYLGNNPGGKISLDYLKAAKEINVSEGYTFVNATLFLQGPGLVDKVVVQITLNSASLANAQNTFNKCQNGVKIFFDYVNVKDKNGVQQMLESPPAFIVYDQQTADYLNTVNPEPKIYLGNSPGGKISLDYLKTITEISLSNGYSFVSCAIWIAGPGIGNNGMRVSLNSKSLSPASTYFERCKSGATIIFDNVRLKDKDGLLITMKSPPTFLTLEKKDLANNNVPL